MGDKKKQEVLRISMVSFSQKKTVATKNCRPKPIQNTVFKEGLSRSLPWPSPKKTKLG